MDRASEVGRLEDISGPFARGWISTPGDADAPVEVEIVEGDRTIAAGLAAARARASRGDAGQANRLAFLIRLPLWLYDGVPHMLHARRSSTGERLAGERILSGLEVSRGQVEGVSDHVLFGWVALHPSERVAPALDVRVGARTVGRAQPRLRRRDIEAQGVAERVAGFRFDLSRHIAARHGEPITVLDPRTQHPLSGTPLSLDAQPAWGVMDRFSGIEASGWAVASRPTGPVCLQVFLNGQLEDTVTADRPRPDLKRIGVKNTQCGFSYSLPARFFDGQTTTLAVVPAGSTQPLRGSARTFGTRIRYAITAVRNRRIEGWIVNEALPLRPIRMEAWLDGEKLCNVTADRPAPQPPALSNAAATLPLEAGFALELPRPAPGWQTRRIRLTLPGTQEPLTGKDIVIAAARGGRVTYREVRPPAPPDTTVPVDVILYADRADDAVLRCARTLLNTRDPIAFELILISDAIEDAKFIAAARQLAEHTGFKFLQNPKPVGLVASMNAATMLHRGRDVVLIKPGSNQTHNWSLSALRSRATRKVHKIKYWLSAGTASTLYVRRKILDELGGFAHADA